MQVPRIDPKNALGLLDKVVGLGKEILGTVTGRDRIAKAGQVQQEQGTERIKAVRAEVKAEGHETKAAAAGQAQRAAQKRKEAMNG
jgi:uncharacterized protein YjbJ (UPF0337 family)